VDDVEVQGVKAFAGSFAALVDGIEAKVEAFRPGAPSGSEASSFEHAR